MIHKLILGPSDAVQLVSCGPILSVGYDPKFQGAIAVWHWAAGAKDRELVVVGTGHELPYGDWEYRGTCVWPTVGLVWHVLEAAGGDSDG